MELINLAPTGGCSHGHRCRATIWQHQTRAAAYVICDYSYVCHL
uniref:Uncharacterized protein n=1 Tax=Arundo donax TaxID=35708 RepID=A0A0A9BRH2_ARUDO